jgi:hypothetical protein
MLVAIMRPWVSALAGALCAALSVVALAPRTALGAPKNKPHTAAPRKPTLKNLKKATPAAAAPDSDAQGDDAANADKTSDKADASNVKTAGASNVKTAPGAAAATVQEDKSGVKTYKFGTVEVEGRMKSPQIIYFLRRVRAEFDAGTLGHRSFMRELSDTRNDTALR